MPSSERARNIRPEVGRFLNLLIKAARARRIVEVGTSNGYSTLWLAEAAATVGGAVATIDVRRVAQMEAMENVTRAGLGEVVEFILGDAHEEIPDIKGPYDLAFLDAEKEDYVALGDLLVHKLPSGGLLVADNITSHPETAAYLEHALTNPLLVTTVVPLGMGEAVSCRFGQPTAPALKTALSQQDVRGRQQPNLEQTPHAEGALLAILARACGARRILEIGTGAGYATLWLALAAQATKGQITSIERDSAHANIARRNLNAAGVSEIVDLRVSDVGRQWRRLEGPFDLIYVDHDPQARTEQVERILALLKPGGLLLSSGHSVHQTALAPYTAYVRSLPAVESMLLPVGHGVEMTWKQRARGAGYSP